MMWFCVLCVAVLFSGSNAQDKTKVPISVERFERHLLVSWRDFNSTQQVESFRVRLDDLDSDDSSTTKPEAADRDFQRRTVFYRGPTTRELKIPCLEPNTRYDVQLVVYFSNNSTDKSDTERAPTKATVPPGVDTFLVNMKRHYQFVLVGAGLAVVVLFIVSGLIFCCCKLCPCCSSRRRTWEREDSTDTKCSLPSKEYLSASPLQERYVPYDSRTKQPRPPSTPLDRAPAPPPFWTVVKSIRRKKVEPEDTPDSIEAVDDCDGDDMAIYENGAFPTAGNSQRQWEEAPVYGNCQF